MNEMKDTISHYFEALEDPRAMRNQRHPLVTLIGTSLLACLSGIDSFSGMQDYVDMHFESLSAHFDFPNGKPSHDTYQRLWDALSPQQFQACFSDFVESLKKVSSDVLSIDGKTIRNSGKDKALHIVSAWCHQNKMVFGQKKLILKVTKSLLYPNF